jgi:TIR domain-containing protein
MATIFMSYRRSDTAGHGGRLADSLRAHYGQGSLFMDVDTIRPGNDFITEIQHAVSRCDVLLVLIGHQWTTSSNSAGQRRLDDPEDYIRLEVMTGLESGLTVIPVLVEGAKMPTPRELPAALAGLARRSAIELTDERWRYDVGRLVQAIEHAREGNMETRRRRRSAKGRGDDRRAYEPPARSSPDLVLPDPNAREKAVRRLVWPVAVGLAFIAGIGVAVVLGSRSSDEGSSKKSAGKLMAGNLTPVPTNHQEGTGKASLRLEGNVATVTLTVRGLLNNAPHAMHIHGGGAGQCPPASAAKLHDGHRAISTTNGAPFYGKPRTSLTTEGPTGPASILAFPRYPATGRFTYTRKIKLIPSALHYVRRTNAVILVHGIDYNHNGLYDGVLDRSELSPEVQGETTAPALCGPIRSAQSASAGGKEVYTASLTLPRLAPAAPRRLCVLGRRIG